ncbi:hypothetical protein J19TS2_32970 [Cohnella xylanilytica]|uniref:Uncharacterized protein n=1 Tax=Cohnella xylanilytica TaxID=557555 RepID=A0A841TV39_9BACL|nr:hypothetical protein [Cohnella xylanilytica]MBB6690908.1 hypothetical protein [Cohnella xylanilytica]GIO13742.1 hypothetical protein J19TS2_32970 [Cohnella xylanilytica]
MSGGREETQRQEAERDRAVRTADPYTGQAAEQSEARFARHPADNGDSADEASTLRSNEAAAGVNREDDAVREIVRDIQETYEVNPADLD